MIQDFISDQIKVMSFKYNDTTLCWIVDCIMPDQTTVIAVPFDKSHFPDHKPVKFMDETVQVGDVVHIWLKEEEVLKSEGWKKNKEYLKSPESPFVIGSKKKLYLGSAHEATIGIDEKFRPFANVKGYRFSGPEIKCVIKSAPSNRGRDARQVSSQGEFVYNSTDQRVMFPDGGGIKAQYLSSVINLLKQARLI